MNWYFISSHKTGDKYINPKNGKEVHSRSHSPKGYNKQFGEIKKVLNTNDLIRVKTGLKNKYIYPLTKNIVPLCKLLSKPYPKKITLQERRANESGMVESNANSKLDA